MNPETNKFEVLFSENAREEKERLDRLQNDPKNQHYRDSGVFKQLFRADGSPVPKQWSIFREGEEVVIKNYTFKVKAIGEDYILFEPVKPVLVGPKRDEYRIRHGKFKKKKRKSR